MAYMAYKSFVEKVKKHLKTYMPEGGVPGKFNKSIHEHIVEIPGKTQREIVEAILIKDGVNDVKEFTKPHRYAHHLNSSQVLCYEFFRPLLDKKGSQLVARDSMMQPVLKAMGLPSEIFLGARAEFEKEFDDGEGTNFDFYLESANGKSRLFIEVKYTEQGFGTCDDNDAHRDKYKNTYLNRIHSALCLNDNAKSMTCCDFQKMRKYYQLFRNTIRVQSENDYVMFLYPEANTIAEHQFEKFKEEYVSKDMYAHVLNVHWEDLKDKMSNNFRDKFFEYSEI